MTDLNEFFENIRNHGTPSTWSGFSEAMFRTGLGVRDTMRSRTIDSYNGSSLIGYRQTGAPRGAFHWWDTSMGGQAAVDVDGGGECLFMASRVAEVRPMLGAPGAGFISFDEYARSQGAYLGWTMDYDGHRLEVSPPPPSPSRLTAAAPQEWRPMTYSFENLTADTRIMSETIRQFSRAAAGVRIAAEEVTTLIPGTISTS